MRLDKYLAETAQCTRSEAKTMLAKGRVQVNGAVCKKGDTQLKCTDTVAVDGALLTQQARGRRQRIHRQEGHHRRRSGGGRLPPAGAVPGRAAG